MHRATSGDCKEVENRHAAKITKCYAACHPPPRRPRRLRRLRRPRPPSYIQVLHKKETLQLLILDSFYSVTRLIETLLLENSAYNRQNTGHKKIAT